MPNGDKDDLPCQEDRVASQEPANMQHILSVYIFRGLLGRCVNFVSWLWSSRKLKGGGISLMNRERLSSVVLLTGDLK